MPNDCAEGVIKSEEGVQGLPCEQPPSGYGAHGGKDYGQDFPVRT